MSQEPLFKAHDSADASSRGADAPLSVKEMVAFYFDEATRLNRHTERSQATILSRNIAKACRENPALHERDVEGGIIVMLEKGLQPTCLASCIAEAQAKRIRPRPKESNHEWARYESEALPTEQSKVELEKLQRALFGPVPTAEPEPTIPSPAPLMTTFPPETPTTT